jgi:NAD(P)-dependent dehydrogenase (short-subunit alcohol dehydrogenase family)
MEFLKEPIRINAIAPGGMLTNMANPELFPQDLDMELVQHFMPKRPPAEAALVADTILYLASERAANIHGSCILSDGAHTAG